MLMTKGVSVAGQVESIAQCWDPGLIANRLSSHIAVRNILTTLYYGVINAAARAAICCWSNARLETFVHLVWTAMHSMFL